uniref:Uncharacterized protein LOC111132847 isoform X1 n=1 Tax=Crassostrea virginica TaxID=6565 RepID=A0A8B8E9S7_CRAVI|nr:uncharacterized protein LOC111132847 isoform X1 [Crassostrea virginica]
MMCPVLGVLKCFFLVSTLLCKDGMTAPSPLQYPYRCPYNQSEWEDRASILKCQGNDVYHCLLSADKVSVKENCIERSLVLQGHCPFFTKEGYLHWATCNETGCPDTHFHSDEVYQHRICFGNTDHQIIENSQKRYYIDDGLSGLEIFGLVASFIVILLVVACVLVARFRFGVCNGEEDEAVKMASMFFEAKMSFALLEN